MLNVIRHFILNNSCHCGISWQERWMLSENISNTVLNVTKTFKLQASLSYLLLSENSVQAVSNWTVQFNAALAIIEAYKDSFREKLYQGFRLEYDRQRLWINACAYFTKISKILSYIYNFTPMKQSPQRHSNTINSISCRAKYFKKYFRSSFINAWNKLDPKIRSSGSYNMFRKLLFKLQ